MANYNESTVTGNRWTRCSSIHLVNDYDNTPSIIFGEEEVIAIEGSANIRRGLSRNLNATFDPVNGSIALRNPTTGEVTGASISHMELYAILYSLYIQEANRLDNEPATTTY